MRSEPSTSSECSRFCVAEGWADLPDDPVRALRLLTAPGVTTVVAVVEGAVVGFAELFSDGEMVPYLASVAVDARFRSRGIGRALVEGALGRAGGTRIDLLSLEASVGFYETFPRFSDVGLSAVSVPSRRSGLTSADL